MKITSKSRKRADGVHYTPESIFEEHIFPSIKDDLWSYCWTDLFCGEGNLIFPIVEKIPRTDRGRFFEQHVRMRDISHTAVRRCISKAMRLGVPEAIARKSISVSDTLLAFPEIDSGYEVYHITNPPYLYIGYIMKHAETQRHLKYFEGGNAGLQDLYQVALANDIRRGTRKMVYIIPSNFLFADSASNRIRRMVFPKYRLGRAIVFEKRIFAETGTNVMVGFFESKGTGDSSPQEIELTKIGSTETRERITVNSGGRWRAGGHFDAIVGGMPRNYIKISFYLMSHEVESSPGPRAVTLVDSSKYSSSSYATSSARVSAGLAEKIMRNDIWVRTVDTGSEQGKAGFYSIRDSFNADGIVVGSNSTYRTSPIQVFIDPPLDQESIRFMRLWANSLLNYMREAFGSDFMTTYKYSNSKYARKYLGLKQAKSLLRACPVALVEGERCAIERLLESKRYREVFGL